MTENKTRINENFMKEMFREVFETQRWFLFAKCTTLEVSGMFSLISSKNPKIRFWVPMDYYGLRGGGGCHIGLRNSASLNDINFQIREADRIT